MQLPFNNSCGENKPRDLKFGGVALAYVGDTNNHIKSALPPTLTGFPGEAEIRYYVKATVKRPQIWRADIRCVSYFRSPGQKSSLMTSAQETNFKFLPIEPPRPADSPQEVFAKRKQQFSKYTPAPAKTGFFRRATAPDLSSTEDPPLLQVEARLPVNTIITCNEPLPLRLLVTKLNETSVKIYLSTLQIELIARTHVRAHGLERVDTTSSILTSKSNMTVQIGSSKDEAHVALVVPPWLWENILVPDTVPPSFNTCNLSRKYELDITIGLTHGDSGAPRPQLMTLPLRMPVKVYSGIKPPPALLKAIATSHQQPHMPMDPGPKPSSIGNHPPIPRTPSSPSTPSYEQHSPRVGTFAPSQQAMLNDDAPPSYEDAMADEIGPVDGPRRDYNIPSQPERRQNSLNDESKGSGLSRKPSERLFSQNDVQSPSRTFSSDSSYFGGNGQVPSSPMLGAVEESTSPSSAYGERTADDLVGKAPRRIDDPRSG